MENILEEILQLTKKKMREQGGYSYSAYKQFIEETIDYFVEKGKLTDDDNLEFIKDRLIDMWNSVNNKIS